MFSVFLLRRRRMDDFLSAWEDYCDEERKEPEEREEAQRYLDSVVETF